MPLVQDIYETLLKDPDLDIGSHQTREEAAENEANFRARQYVNNVRALSLATEPVQKESNIQALVNHISSLTKSLVSSGFLFLQKIDKGGLSTILAGHSKSAADKLFTKNPLVVKKLAKFHSSGQDFFKALLSSGVPVPNVVDMLNHIHDGLSKTDSIGSADWVPSMVDNVLKPNSEVAQMYGMEPSHLHKFHGKMQEKMPGLVVDSPAFKPNSYHPDKQDFYGSNTKKQLTQQATIENVNAALGKMDFPHKVAVGSQDRLKFVNKDGSDVANDAYHNPFAGSRKGGRLYASHIEGKDPDADTPNLFGVQLGNYSVADILNAVHHNAKHPEGATPPAGMLEEDPKAPPEPTPPAKTDEEAGKELEGELGKAKKHEEEVIKKTPPKKPNKAGNTPQSAKDAGQKAKSMPHVIFGAWGGPQHGVKTNGVAMPHHVAHTLAMQQGICNHLGQVNKAGMTLLQSAYDSGVLRKKHVQIKDTHCILGIDGIVKLLEHHGIDLTKGTVLGKDVASHIAGQELATDMMPEGIDWEELAKKLSDPIPTGGAGDIPQDIIEEAEEETGKPAEPPIIGNPADAYEAKAKAHAARLNAAYDGMGVDDMDLAALETALGHIQNMHNTVPSEHMTAAIKALIGDIHPDHLQKFTDYVKSPDGGLMHPSIGEELDNHWNAEDIEDGFPQIPTEQESDTSAFKGVLADYIKDLVGAKNKTEHDNAMEMINSAIKNNPMKKYGVSGKEINEAIRDVVGKHTNNPAGFMEHHGFPNGQHFGMSEEDMKKEGISPTPFTPHKTPWAGTHDDQHGKLSKKLTALAKTHAKHKEDAAKFPELQHIADDSQEELHGAIQEGIKDGAITHAGIKDAIGKGLAGSPHADTIMDELPSDIKEGIDAAPTDSTPQPTPTPEEQETPPVEEPAPEETTPEDVVEPEDEDVVEPEDEEPIEPTPEAKPDDEPAVEPEGEDEKPTTPADEPTPEVESEPTTPEEGEEVEPTPEEEPVPEEPPKEEPPKAAVPDAEKDAAKKAKVMTALFGENWEDDEDAQTYSEYLDENPKDLASAYKQHVIQPIANKKLQEAKDAKKQQETEAKSKAKEQAKAKKQNANVLPSEPGELDSLVADDEDGDETVGEPLATQHARELMAHQLNHKDSMEPGTKKKLIEALHECKKHGADFDALMKEKEELGEDFGTPKHLQQARQDAATKAEIHENHKKLTAHDSEDQDVTDAQAESYDGGKHKKFTEFDDDGNPVKGEDEDETEAAQGKSGMKHHVLHTLDPMQQKIVAEMKEAKANGDEEGYNAAAKKLEETGIPMKDTTHSGDDAPKTGPPDPEVAQKKQAEGYVWHEETRSWILKDTLKELDGHAASGGGGGASMVSGDYGGAASHGDTKFDTQTGERNHKPFAMNEDGTTPSSNNFMHNSNGLHKVGDGNPPTGGAASHQNVNENVLAGKLAADGHSKNHAKAKNGISRLPNNFGHPADADKMMKPKSLGQQAKEGFKSGIASALANKKSGTPFLEGLKGKFVGKGYPMPEGIALETFLKQYGRHDHLKDKASVHDLLERLKNEDDEKQDDKSLQESIIR